MYINILSFLGIFANRNAVLSQVNIIFTTLDFCSDIHSQLKITK